jgi:4-hydroxybenzoate polyprenyltransferase
VTNPEPWFSRLASTLRGYLELVRLPNVFTAMADVAMGFLFTRADFLPGEDGWLLGLLLAASSLLYAAGVVLNDVFDLEVDAVERPHRPLPSGRVSPAVARWLGWELLVVGLAAAWWPAAWCCTTAG